MQKTIGGDRLGAGKKQTVQLKNYERSTHDLGYIWRSTMASGTLVPFMTEVGLPGDTFDIALDADIKTHPTIGPLFGSYKVQLDVFVCPVRLYQGQLHNNKLGIGMDMAQIKLPVMEIVAGNIKWTKKPDNQQINPSSIFSYLNITGLGKSMDNEQSYVTRKFNAIPYLAYWDIYKNYYANKQEEVGAMVHSAPKTSLTKTITAVKVNTVNGTQQYALSEQIGINFLPNPGIIVNNPNDYITLEYTGAIPILKEILINTAELGAIILDTIVSSIDTGTAGIAKYRYSAYNKITLLSWRYITNTDILEEEPQVTYFPLENIDIMRENILAATKITTPFQIDWNSISPYGLPFKRSEGTTTNTIYSQMASQEGLGLKTYQSDLFNNWISTEWIDGDNGINAITAIDTSDDSFTIDTLNLSKKVYDMLNRIAISGGSYDDWLDAVYTHERYRRAESPMYMGGLSKELVFQEVVSVSEGAEGQPLGTLAGKGIMAKKHKGGKVTVKIDEPSYIMGIVSLTPRIDYSQGNKWDVNLKTMDDFHKPALDEIGFQDLITDQMASWDTTIGGIDEGIIFKSAGKQPAWINYMTNVNIVKGNFAIEENEMFMTLNRRYEGDETEKNIKDLTTYIDPVKFNHIFAETARDAQNFWAQIGVDITARRKMSAKVMPNL